MSPINLDQLRNDQIPPTGLVQLTRYGTTAGSVSWNNTMVAQPLRDTLGNQLRINVTPVRAAWWVIRSETLWSQPDAIWSMGIWSVRISPVDLDGQSGPDQAYLPLHSAIGYQCSVIDTAFRLAAGVAYTAAAYWEGSWGYTQQNYAHAVWDYISGELVGEGVV